MSCHYIILLSQQRITTVVHNINWLDDETSNTGSLNILSDDAIYWLNSYNIRMSQLFPKSSVKLILHKGAMLPNYFDSDHGFQPWHF